MASVSPSAPCNTALEDIDNRVHRGLSQIHTFSMLALAQIPAFQKPRDREALTHVLEFICDQSISIRDDVHTDVRNAIGGLR